MIKIITVMIKPMEVMMTIIFAFLVIIQTLENYIGINKAASD